MNKNKHRRIDRSAVSRELPAYSSPEQSLQDKKMMDAITNVMGQISNTNDISRTGVLQNMGSSPSDEKEKKSEWTK